MRVLETLGAGPCRLSFCTHAYIHTWVSTNSQSPIGQAVAMSGEQVEELRLPVMDIQPNWNELFRFELFHVLCGLKVDLFFLLLL